MGEVVPAPTSPTLHPPSPPTVHQLLRLALYELIFTITVGFFCFVFALFKILFLTLCISSLFGEQNGIQTHDC